MRYGINRYAVLWKLVDHVCEVLGASVLLSITVMPIAYVVWGEWGFTAGGLSSCRFTVFDPFLWVYVNTLRIYVPWSNIIHASD